MWSLEEKESCKQWINVSIAVVIRWFQTLIFAEQINQEAATEDQEADSLLDNDYSVEKTSDTTEGNNSGK